MSSFVPMMLLVLICSTVKGAWSMPDAAEQERLDRALAPRHSTYDPAQAMVRIKVFNPGYHINLPTGALAHSTKASLDYALELLDTGKPANRTRAIDVLHKVLSLQDTDPASRTYGIWSWYLEAPLPRMKAPDFNWADFCGTTLLQITRDHRSRLPTDLAAQVSTFENS